MMSLIMTINPVISNKANALNSTAKPRRVISPGNPGTASHSSKSADINAANAANTSNRAILIIKMATSIFNTSGRYCTQFFSKRLDNQYLQYLKTHRP